MIWVEINLLMHFVFMNGQISFLIGFGDVGWNQRRILTPHMDALAKNGIILNQHYALPSCSPSRTSLMTGYKVQYCIEIKLTFRYYALRTSVREALSPYERNGVNVRYKFLPQFMKDLGYSTYAVGK